MTDTDSGSLSESQSTLLSGDAYLPGEPGEGFEPTMPNTTAGQRLRQARLAAGFRTIKAAADRFGFHKQNLADHEADRRGISVENASAYAKAFRVKPGWILLGEGDSLSSGTVQTPEPLRDVPIIGEVRAGAWAEVMDDYVEGHALVSLPEYDRAQLFALRVVGRSMDRIYPEGTILICCPAAEAGVRAGDHVIVRRHKGSLVETTVKEVVQDKDGIALWPRSSDPAHQTPYRLQSARDADEGPEIIGVVITHQPPPRPRSGPLLLL